MQFVFKKFIYFFVAIILTLGLSISFQSLLAAWSGPTLAPPDGNVSAPINESTVSQVKLGGLGIAGNFLVGVNSFFVNSASGVVGIGTINPQANLDINGTGALITPRGTTAQQPATPVNGMLRYDTTAKRFTVYRDNAWAYLLTSSNITTGGGVCNASETYDSPGTYIYVVPPDFQTLTIKIWGGGGGGGGQFSSTCGIANGTVGGNSSIASYSLAAGGGQRNNNSSGGSGGIANGGSINLNGNNGQTSTGGWGGYGGAAAGIGGGAGGTGGINIVKAGNGSAPGGAGGGNAFNHCATGAGGGGGGAYVEKIFTPATLAPGTVISDVSVGAGGIGGNTEYDGGDGANGKIIFTCSTSVGTASGQWETSGDNIYNTNIGNVGIGISSPNSLLHMNRTAGANAEIDIQSIDGVNKHWAIYHDRATDDLRFWNNTPASEKNILALTNEGNVGIGTTTPGQLLTVGNAFQVNSSGNLVKINNISYSWPAIQGGAGTVLTNNGSGGLSWSAAGGGGGGWTDGGTNVYLTTSADNVGIGTTDPGQKLTVAGTIESTNGGFKFPDGTIQTTKAATLPTCAENQYLQWKSGAWACSTGAPALATYNQTAVALAGSHHGDDMCDASWPGTHMAIKDEVIACINAGVCSNTRYYWYDTITETGYLCCGLSQCSAGETTWGVNDSSREGYYFYNGSSGRRTCNNLSYVVCVKN